ncbi:MAG TPA: hypothetical protein VKT99_16210 [Xanthobacteraceae bacterium]|nr:hypothetical protein [Xanthobacteraceae bacterium]
MMLNGVKGPRLVPQVERFGEIYRSGQVETEARAPLPSQARGPGEAGTDDLAAGVDGLAGIAHDVGFDSNDAAAGNRHVAHGVKPD